MTTRKRRSPARVPWDAWLSAGDLIVTGGPIADRYAAIASYS